MLEWINQHDGVALVGLTLVYVIATLIIVTIMAKSNRLAAKGLKLTSDLERERSRPYVLFDIEMAHHMVKLIVKNIGSTPAVDVVVQVEPPISSDKDRPPSNLTGRTIKFIAPGRKFSDFIDSSPSFLKRYSNAQFRGRIVYFDTSGRKYTDSIHIDLEFQGGLLYSAGRDIGQELEGIKKSLDTIAQTLRQRESDPRSVAPDSLPRTASAEDRKTDKPPSKPTPSLSRSPQSDDSQQQDELQRRWESARRILSDGKRYPNIPRALVKQIERCVAKKHLSRSVLATLHDPALVVPAIDKMFSRASAITGSVPDELLRQTDFHPNDIAPHRVESAFAEIRTINFLDTEGFREIRLVRGGSQKGADVVATRGSERYVVGVATSIYEASCRYSPEQMCHWCDFSGS